jgi:hypothetical protein
VTARAKRPTSKPPPPHPRERDSLEELPTEVYQPALLAKQEAAKRMVSPSIQAISMKTPAAEKLAVDYMRAEPEPVLKRPKLRSIAEVTPPSGIPRIDNIGYIAPPRDPVEVRGRRVREVMVLASVSVIIASVVALAIWFLAR